MSIEPVARCGHFADVHEMKRRAESLRHGMGVIERPRRAGAEIQGDENCLDVERHGGFLFGKRFASPKGNVRASGVTITPPRKADTRSRRAGNFPSDAEKPHACAADQRRATTPAHRVGRDELALVGADREHRARGRANDTFRDAAHDQLFHRASSVRADNDQVDQLRLWRRPRSQPPDWRRSRARGRPSTSDVVSR